MMFLVLIKAIMGAFAVVGKFVSTVRVGFEW